MKSEIEVIEIDFNDFLKDDVEIINIDDIDVEIIDVNDINFDVVSTNKFNNKKINKGFLNKIRKKLSKGKIAVVATCCVTLIVTLTSVFMVNNTIWKKHDNSVYMSISDNVIFNLNEPEYNYILLNEDYIEKGSNIIIDGIDYSNQVVVDSSSLDNTKVGDYQVSYTYRMNDNQEFTIYRSVKVIDNEAPSIKLLGSNVYTMLVNDEFFDEGIFITDNSNYDLSGNVLISTDLDTSKAGKYYVNYSVNDNSGNVSNVVRTVIVKNSYVNNSNTILSNKFIDNGIYFSGCVQNTNFQYKMLIKNKTNGFEKIIDVVKTSNHYYNISLDVTNYENGVYEFYLVSDELELLVNNMNEYNRIVRSRVGNKLITMDYTNNKVNMIVEDFKYLYDVVIDPGHGGKDTGAVNGSYYEKRINLEQSLYEKRRYEEHGLSVLLLRDDDTYGIMMGNSSWEALDRKGYAIGYYGSVSRIIYSNHHNSSNNPTSAGWEILVPANASYDMLLLEHKIADIWSNMYMASVDPYYRFYTKDYENASVNNKINGEIYSFDDYYAVIRVPKKLFNVKNVIFEGAYINNNNDMNWYYKLGNWKDLSEIKIKTYVESLGIDYIAP